MLIANPVDRRGFHRALARTGLGASLASTVPVSLLLGLAQDTKSPQSPTGAESMVLGLARDTQSLRLPTSSDTIISPRSPSAKAIEVIDAFHPTRAEWHYAMSAEFIRQMREGGVGFVSGTINANDAPGADASVGIEGTPNIAPWMRGNVNPKPFSNSASSKTHQALADWVQRSLDLGVDGIVFDDPLPLASAEGWAGGDFSTETQAQFRQWLIRNPIWRSEYGDALRSGQAGDFRQYLAASGITDLKTYRARRQHDPSLIAWRNFLLELDVTQMASLRARTYRSVPHPLWSGNLNTPHPSEEAERLLPLLDYVTCEINSDRITDVYISANMLAASGKPLVASSRATSNDVHTIRHSIAAGFAVGAIPIIPWDVYVPPHDGKPYTRFYGQASDFAATFDFFKHNAGLLASYRIVPSIGIVFSIGETPMVAFRQMVDECIRWGVAFKVLTCGGEMEQRPVRTNSLAGLELVIDPASGGSLSSANVEIIRAAGIRLITGLVSGFGAAHQMTGAFFADERVNWCAIPRLGVNGRAAWFIVPRDYGTAPLPAGTKLTVRTEAPLRFATPSLLDLEGRRRLTLTPGVNQVEITLPAVTDFAVVIS